MKASTIIEMSAPAVPEEAAADDLALAEALGLLLLDGDLGDGGLGVDGRGPA